MTTRAGGWSRAAVSALVVAAVDQGTKALATASLDRGESVSVFIGIDLTNVRNTGVAFGLFSGGGIVIGLLTAVALALLLGYFALRAGTPWLWLPVGMLLGGALGNLIDRARLGAVVDFIDPAFWPAFNLADSAIVIGILGLLYVSDPGTRPPRTA